MTMDAFMQQLAYGPRKIAVVGHYGSGKTEFAVSLAFALGRLREAGELREAHLAVCDLDIANPYFRSREVQGKLEAAGIAVYSDPFDGRNGSELQVITAKARAPLEDETCRVICDCGGDSAGASVLVQFQGQFKTDCQTLCVINRNRPGSATVQQALDHIDAIEAATGVTITGLVSNAHFIRETTAQDVVDGWMFTRDVADASGIPVLCACAMESIAEEAAELLQTANAEDGGVAVFPMGMHLRESYLDMHV